MSNKVAKTKDAPPVIEVVKETKKPMLNKVYSVKNFNTLEDVAEYLNMHPEVTKDEFVYMIGVRFPCKLLVYEMK